MVMLILMHVYHIVSVLDFSSAHPNHATSCPEMTPCSCYNELLPDLNSSITSNWVMAMVLDCQMRDLTVIPNLTPVAEFHIERLWLDYNQIENVTENDFREIKVKEILLNGNNIKSIHQNAFRDMKEVILKLTLSESSDLEISSRGLRFLSGMTNLRHLDLRSTRLEADVLKRDIFDVFNLTSLRFLNMENVSMTDIEDGAFSGLHSLQTLEIGYNLFGEPPIELRRLSNLNELSLRNVYGIKLKKDSFKDMHNLKSLILSNIGLTIYPTAALENLDNLEELVLSSNEITKLSVDSFKGKYTLKHLDVGGNPISFVKNMFGRLSYSLTTITLSGMNISRPPTEILRELPYLDNLEMENCNITEVDEHFFAGLSLSSVDLSYNRYLQTVSQKAFAGMKMPLRLELRQAALSDISFLMDSPVCSLEFKFLDLNYVDIQCDCELEKLVHSGQLGGNMTATCYFDDRLNMHYFTVSESEIISSYPSGLESKLVSRCGRTRRKHTCPDVVTNGINTCFNENEVAITAVLTLAFILEVLV